MRNIKKILLWVGYIFVVVLIISLLWDKYFKGHLLIVAVAFLAFLPFIDRVIKAFFKDEDSTNTLGIPFKDFITPWIMFWGLSGIVISYKQTQDMNKQQEQKISIEAHKDLENKYYMYIENLQHDNEGLRNEAIDNLYAYAYEHPSWFLKTVCEVFCSHIRMVTSDSIYRKNNSKNPRKDIQNIINRLLKKDRDTLIFASFRKSLEGTYLYGVDFQNAILNNVDFEEATLSKANFKSAKLDDVNFRDAILNDKVSFEEAELTNVNFRFNTLTNVNFTKSKIKIGRFKNTKLNDVNFDAYIDVADFGESEMKNVNFRNDSLKSVSFRNASLKNVNFTNAKFDNVDFWTKKRHKKEDVNFNGTIFENDDLEIITSKYYTTEKTTNK